jgi:hypothetical protein
MAYITLTRDGVTKYLHSAKVSYSWKNLDISKPNEQSFANTEVQFNGWENPIYNLTFYLVEDQMESNDLTWAEWMVLVKNKPTSTNNITLAIKTGQNDSEKEFKSYGTSTDGVTEVPVVIKSFSLAFDAKSSVNGYFWTVNAQLQETN